MSEIGKFSPQHRGGVDTGDTDSVDLTLENHGPHLTYLSILVDGFQVQSRGDHGWPPLACGILSSSSDIEGCRVVVSGVIWIRLLGSARLIQV